MDLQRIVELEEQATVDDGVYTIIDSVSAAAKKFPLGEFIRVTNDAIDKVEENQSMSILSSSAYKASSTNYENVGVSVAVPTGHYAIVTFTAYYASGAPVGIAITNNASAPGAANLIYISENSNAPRSTPALLLVGGYTYYMWVKRGSVPAFNNNHDAFGVIV